MLKKRGLFADHPLEAPVFIGFTCTLGRVSKGLDPRVADPNPVFLSPGSGKKTDPDPLSTKTTPVILVI